MFNRLFFYLKNLDWILFASVLLLVSFGLAEIYSIALGQGSTDLLDFKKQILFVVLGFLLFFLVAFFDYLNWRDLVRYLYVLGIFALLVVLVLGKTINGTRGWFSLAGFSLQPVEFIKIILILFLARYFSDISLKVRPLKHLFISGLGALILFILVAAQPDFGSAMLLFAIWLMMIALAGFKKKYFLIIFLVISFLSVAGWSFYLKPYQKERILTFINPSFNPLEQGYNVSQAIIAVGGGGLMGRGIGFGSQSQLKFLPESHTDFIFAVISEELGFFGVFLVLSFFSLFFYRCFLALKRINNDFGIFLILGAVGLIFIEMFINIGMNMGILPVVGIALPFLSYGGSSMMANLALAGIIESIIIRSKIR